MANLKTIKLGTDREKGWMYYDCHKTSCLVLKEYFEASNYLSGMKKIETAAKSTIQIYEKLGLSVARERELEDWARQMREEGYHELFSMAFISMWSAFEAGIENLITTYIEFDKTLSEKLHHDFSLKIQLSKWPWSFEERLGIVKKLERKAMDGNPSYQTRVARLLSYLEISLIEGHGEIPEEMVNLDEANKVRNIILHRYGEVGERDAKSCPALEPWLNQPVPFDEERFRRYKEALTVTLVTTMVAIQRSRYALKDTPKA